MPYQTTVHPSLCVCPSFVRIVIPFFCLYSGWHQWHRRCWTVGPQKIKRVGVTSLKRWRQQRNKPVLHVSLDSFKFQFSSQCSSHVIVSRLLCMMRMVAYSPKWIISKHNSILDFLYVICVSLCSRTSHMINLEPWRAPLNAICINDVCNTMQNMRIHIGTIELVAKITLKQCMVRLCFKI